ncbi:MAG: DNA excision repair protein ERCC-2, partial [Natrialbaceae archaeon]
MTAEEDWREVFGHQEPYKPQVDGIETAVETAQDRGFTVLEGACGTGKTMLALTAGIHLVRDPDSDFERVLVLTSVKQQLRQFEADLRTINANLSEEWSPVSGLTLVGKADVCPYNREGAGGIDDGNVYNRCETLREHTRDVTGEGGSTTAQALTGRARSQQVGLADSGRGGNQASYLETANEPTPYPPEMPEYEDGGTSTEYCPFYAGFLEALPEDGDPVEAVPFDFEDAGLIEPDDLVAQSAGHGTCPHSIMGALLPHVEVVVGNYYHAFDPTTTAAFTAPLLDDETFVICDEAHMLEPRVRDLVSDGMADASLRDAEAELSRVIQPLAFEGRGDRVEASADADLIRAELAEVDVSRDDLEAVQSLIQDLREELDRRVTAFLDREHEGWRADLAALDNEEIPLRDPERPQPDAITEWGDREGHTEEIWRRAEAVGRIVARILDAADDEEKQRAIPGVGRTLAAWRAMDHETFFREIEL